MFIPLGGTNWLRDVAYDTMRAAHNGNAFEPDDLEKLVKTINFFVDSQ